MMEGCSNSDDYNIYGSGQSGQQTARSNELMLTENDSLSSAGDSIVAANTTRVSSGKVSSHTEVDEMGFLISNRAAGVVHIMGNTVVTARKGSRFYKRISVDYIYAFLRKICREYSDR